MDEGRTVRAERQSSWLRRLFGGGRHSRGPGDDLKELGSRLDLKQCLDRGVVGLPGRASERAMLVVDLDRFEAVNDDFGQTAGDEVLRLTARRILALISAQGTAFRSGPDEFVAVLDHTTEERACSTAQRLLTAIGEPVQAGETSVRVSASVAVVMLTERRRLDDVLRDADVAMYRAKVTGGNRVEIFSRALDDWALARKYDVDSLAQELEELRLENQRLTEAVMVDSRTGLPNGVAFEADHLQLYARRNRSGERYSLLLADIDHFHHYNERFLPSEGNRALRAVGQTIRSNVRQGDRAYRFDGEQFSVLLPGAHLREAVVAAERIRSKIENLAIDHPDNPAGVVTVTVGVVEAGFRHPTTKAVLAEAHSLLLEGKHSGRNRIVWPH
jgi:diguanylate cyclase (GGDEF)-like protein